MNERPLPLFLITSLSVPLICSVVILIHPVARKMIPFGDLSMFAAAVSLVVGLNGLLNGERPRWLFILTIAACVLVYYACTFIDD